MKKYLLLAAAAATMAASPVLAQAYTGGSGTFTGLGSDQTAYPGTLFDTVNLAPIAGTFTFGPGTYALNAVTFTEGVNRNDSNTFTGVLSGLSGTFGGNPVSYSVNYSIDIAANDTITLGGNSFSIGGKSIYINPLTLATSSASPTVLGTLTVSVPEPATWMMMILGFGMVGFGLRYRRNQQARVTYA